MKPQPFINCNCFLGSKIICCWSFWKVSQERWAILTDFSTLLISNKWDIFFRDRIGNFKEAEQRGTFRTWKTFHRSVICRSICEMFSAKKILSSRIQLCCWRIWDLMLSIYQWTSNLLTVFHPFYNFSCRRKFYLLFNELGITSLFLKFIEALIRDSSWTTIVNCRIKSHLVGEYCHKLCFLIDGMNESLFPTGPNDLSVNYDNAPD